MIINKYKNSFLLALAAFIWGIAFVAQTTGGDALGSFTFNGIRSLIGALVLQPVIMFLDKSGKSPKKPQNKEEKKQLLKAGVLCGIALFIATSSQQVGLTLGVPAGKAGFITACYILIVPLISIFIGKKCSIKIWIGVFLSLVGLYLLCMKDGLNIDPRDALIILCAFVFSFQILFVDHYSPIVDGVRLSQLQFLICGLCSVPVIIFQEIGFKSGAVAAWINNFNNPTAWIALLYAGILSCGVAYTLQIIGQEGVNPTVASMIMSLESVFSVLAGWVLLGQTLSRNELIGCVLIFIAIILAQL